jgi:hypothetical protein
MKNQAGKAVRAEDQKVKLSSRVNSRIAMQGREDRSLDERISRSIFGAENAGGKWRDKELFRNGETLV